ncbi:MULTISPECIES: hypothetical protein [unclassified Methylobacterium]|jgi:hypothetical protein|uniref:hypothetical protein n=1 Tax=unclassified Methylobacterium TaxID=2615210 RepID=UPI0011146E8C|nr:MULTISPECIES: hypothetical protein [unclassified Methylobacterium]
MPRRDFVNPSFVVEGRKSSWSEQLDSCGIWIGRVDDKMQVCPAQIYGAHKIDAAPLVAVLLGHVAQSIGEIEFASQLIGEAGSRIKAQRSASDAREIAYALATGDRERIGRLEQHLGKMSGGYAPVPNTVLKLHLPAAPAPRPAMRMGFGPG